MDFKLPFHITIGEFTLHSHLLFETLAFFIGFRFFMYLRKKQSDTISSSNRLSIIIGATLGALIGSRLIGGLENPSVFFSGNMGPLYYYQSKTIVGGLLGGLAGVEILKYFIGEKKSSGDLFTYPLILAMIIGRIGCFLTGIEEPTYGLTTSLPWGMNLGDGELRHPVALYEIGFLLILWSFLSVLKKRLLFKPGSIFKLFLFNYLFFRLGIDFLKPGNPILLELTSIQWTCLIGIAYYYQILLSPRYLLTTKS